MTPPEPKKPPRGLRTTPTSSTKSPIATPPRVALRSKPDDTASTKSTNDDEDEKDAKIAELQNELQTMAHEFERELTHLSHKLTNESETAQFWQQKHASLNQAFEKCEGELRMRDERDRDVQTRMSGLVVEREQVREAYNEAVGEVREKEDVIRALMGQVRGLKSWVSSSSKSGEQVTDEVFGERMVRLGNGLQNWVIVNFRRVRVDTENANDQTKEQLQRLIPTYESLATSTKIHLIQSIVSRLLVEFIFEAYFVGLPKEHADELEKVDKYLSRFGSVENMNGWRSTTLGVLQKEAPQRLHTETAAIVDSIVNQINSIATSISDIQPSETRDQSLRVLINSSIELSRLLRVQKAVFTVIMPSLEDHQRTMFDSESMEDIGGEDEETLSEREIRCVTFPGIVKAGDENGERGYLRNVVAKTRVLCTPD